MKKGNSTVIKEGEKDQNRVATKGNEWTTGREEKREIEEKTNKE